MMTVATAARLKEGAEQEWDTVIMSPGTGIGHPLLDGAPVGFSGLPGRHRYIVDPL